MKKVTLFVLIAVAFVGSKQIQKKKRFEKIFVKKTLKPHRRLITKVKFAEMVCHTESRGKYNVANKYGYLGKYQIGEKALLEIGYKKKWIDSVKKTIYTKENSKGVKMYFFDKSLFPPKEQEVAINKYFSKMENVYLKNTIDKYVGKTIDGIYITKAGILGASMLGCGYVKKFLNSNGSINPCDANGVTIRSKFLMYEEFELKSCY